ncbi:hypothetical protein, conserved [Entamoeba dispar SAW760]|uniref:Uncharacterized protein n=1 Tax=Entamoeba dispar (strain ATCC PRA-260 / SAW760) TaxID=370354 RepID=B0EH77_ENTDS|nr:uncharacterized protein EDI_024130 [Entamoeba dispar SAW760]EDR26129.1 hypothetical protein, conserved [Entamoeba dispar SAW760]|eukprot:EDR26129.1 hypothetical protein, conserved [Entamoeba dispar SAW760]
MSPKGKKLKQSPLSKEPIPDDGFSFVRQYKSNVIIEIEIKPNAKTSELQGVEDGILKVAIDAPPIDGKANTEVIAFMASTFGIKKSNVSLIKGQTSHHKTLQFENWTREKVLQIIQSK